MFKMIVQLHRRTEVTGHATIAEARERLARICSAANVRAEGDNTTGELIALTREGNDNPLVNWNYGAYLIVEVDADALVYVVEHADGVERFPSEAEARHFQTTIAPGSSRRVERAAVGMLDAGARVVDAGFAQRYGRDAARVGTILRKLDAPAGMVQVRWDADPLDADQIEDVENCWVEELAPVDVVDAPASTPAESYSTVIDTTSPEERVNGKLSHSALMPFGNQLVGRIDAWLQEHPGMHTPSRIARAVKADTHEAYMVLSWLDDRGMFVVGDGNGMRRRYGARDGRPAA
ncbi:hypothetical protein SEA_INVICTUSMANEO_88 [Mycobacterium phage InvictusManeo]|nr:hypothetical protein SEA_INVICTUSMANEO_88 [Mycobacterium phage InvictusManeo]